MQELDARAKSLLAALKADSRSGATQLAMNTLDQLLSYLDEVEPEGETFLRLLAELRAARPSMIAIGNAQTEAACLHYTQLRGKAGFRCSGHEGF